MNYFIQKIINTLNKLSKLKAWILPEDRWISHSKQQSFEVNISKNWKGRHSSSKKNMFTTEKSLQTQAKNKEINKQIKNLPVILVLLFSAGRERPREFPDWKWGMNKIYVLIIVFEVWVLRKNINLHSICSKKGRRWDTLLIYKRVSMIFKSLWIWTFWRHSLRNSGIFHKYWL